MYNLFLQILGTAKQNSEANLSSLTFMAPIFAFLFVVVVMFALLKKSELLGKSDWTNMFVSLFSGVLFVSFAGARSLVLEIVPWFVILFVCIFFIMVLTGLMGNTKDIVGKRLGWFFVIIFIAIIFFLGMGTFSVSIFSYIPGPFFGEGITPEKAFLLDWFYSSELFSTILLVLSAGVVCWVLVKGKK